MSRKPMLDQICREFGLLAVYLFGSRADDGQRLIAGGEAVREGSDLDVGVVFQSPDFEANTLSLLQLRLEDVFAPLQVDVVPLQRVDALFQYNAILGHRVATTDSTAADRYELIVMNRASELAPIQRQIERERFGVSTT